MNGFPAKRTKSQKCVHIAKVPIGISHDKLALRGKNPRRKSIPSCSKAGDLERNCCAVGSEFSSPGDQDTTHNVQEKRVVKNSDSHNSKCRFFELHALHAAILDNGVK